MIEPLNVGPFVVREPRSAVFFRQIDQIQQHELYFLVKADDIIKACKVMGAQPPEFPIPDASHEGALFGAGEGLLGIEGAECVVVTVGRRWVEGFGEGRFVKGAKGGAEVDTGRGNIREEPSTAGGGVAIPDAEEIEIGLSENSTA